MAASITVYLQIFKRQQLLHFSNDLDETDTKSHGLLRYINHSNHQGCHPL